MSRERAAAGRKWREAPQRPGKSLEPAGRIAVVRAVHPEPDLRAPRRKMRDQRLREIRGKFLQVGAREQGIVGNGRIHSQGV